MPKHYREGCYDPDCGICYPPLKSASKPTLRKPSAVRGAEAERERIIGILNRPSLVLTAAVHYQADGAAWLGEAFLAEYLKP